MATAEKGKPTPQEPERKFPLWPLIGAVVAILAQRVNQRAEFNMWLYWVAGALIGIAAIFHFAPRKNGKVVATPFNLDVYGPFAVCVFTALVAWKWVKDDNTASTVTLTLACGAFAVIAWGYWLAAQHRSRDFQLLRDRLLVAIGVSAGFGYANFGHLHFDNFIHTWDTYHYYIGAKYFPEVGYDRMYECAIIADSEDFPPEKLAKMREQRIVTNLRTNIMEKVGETVLLRAQECKGHFSNERWSEFKKDIAFFRARVNDKRWEEIHHDHGYNASPVWTLLGYVITNTGTATLQQITFVDLFDPLYLALMAAMIWWAFGPRVFAVALIMLGTNWASRFFYWTGGALLRHDWLFYTVAVVCLAKKGKHLMAGVALAYATLLRLFPGLMLIGTALAAFEYARVWFRSRSETVTAPGGPSRPLRILGLGLVSLGAVISLLGVIHALSPLPEASLHTPSVDGLTAQLIENQVGREHASQKGIVEFLAGVLAAAAGIGLVIRARRGPLLVDEPAGSSEPAFEEPQPPSEYFWKRYAAMNAAQKTATQRTLAVIVGGPAALVFYLFTRDAQLGRVTALLLVAAIALVAVLHTLEVIFARVLSRGPRWLSPTIARFALGGLLATVALGGASLWFFGGLETWQRFAQNTAKHAATPLTNHMGMRTIFSSLPWTNGAHMRDSKQLDAWQPWKDKRVEIFKLTRPLFVLAALAGLVLLFFAVRGVKGLLWASSALGAGFIVLGAELTNYYYVFFVALAALFELRREVGMWLCALVATCIFIMLTPIMGMSGWQDDQSLAMSIASLIAVGGIWWTFTPWAKKYLVDPEPPPVLVDETAAPAAVPAHASAKKKKR